MAVLLGFFLDCCSDISKSASLPTATLLGCLPNNFLAVNAGSKLGELNSVSDLYDYKIILAGVYVTHAAFVLPSLAATLWKKQALPDISDGSPSSTRRPSGSLLRPAQGLMLLGILLQASLWV